MDAGNYGPGLTGAQPVAVEAAGDTAAVSPTPAQVTPAVPEGDTRKAVRFIVDLIGKGLISVAALDPEEEKPSHGATFDIVTEQDGLYKWIDARQGKYNLHFVLNEPVPTAQQKGANGRIGKADIHEIRGVVIDCDPRFDPGATDGGLAKERERLKGKVTVWRDQGKVSAVIDTGGGCQGVWLFREPLSATLENVRSVEAQARGLAQLEGGDNTHDVSHLFRLPWTINLPNEQKRERKRTPALAQGIVYDDPDRLHTLNSLKILAPPVTKAAVAASQLDIDLGLAWEVVGDPDALPPELAARLTEMRAERPPLDSLLKTEAAAVTDRSQHDFAIAAAVIKGGLIDSAQVAAVVAAFSPDKFREKEDRRDEARAEDYLSRTVRNALARVGPQRFFHVIKDEAETGVETAPHTASTAGTESFGDPVDIFGDDDPADLSTPPVGCLPDVIEGYAQTEAGRIGVPLIFAAAAAVTAAGGAIGNALQIQPRRHDPTYTEPAALWTVLVGPPGCAKSPTISSAMKPLREVDRRLMDASEREHRDYEARKAAAGKEKAVLLGPPPPRRRAIIDDVTPEQQIRMHQQNPRGLMRHVDEYVSFLNFGAYKRSGDGDRGRALQFFDGGSIVLDRVSETRPIRADTALMGLLSSTQPDRIGPVFQNLGVDGLGQRTLFVLWDGVERRFVDRAPDLKALDEYATAIRALAGIDKMSGGTVRLSVAAHVIMDRVDALIRRQAHLPGASAAWEGHISKWGKLLPRITLIFHALDSWSFVGGVPVDAEVTADTMRKAGQFALFLLKHSWQFYRTNSEPQERTTAARWIAGWILTHPDILSVTPRDIERACKDLRRNRNALLAAMRDLEEHAWVEVSRQAPPGSTGPGAWRVNPDVHRRFADRAVREKAERAAKRAMIDAAVAAQRGGPDDA